MFIVRVETARGRSFYRKFFEQHEMMDFVSRYVEDYECATATSELAIFEDSVQNNEIEFGIEAVELDIENRVSFEIVKV
jgi:hypothetical protein